MQPHAEHIEEFKEAFQLIIGYLGYLGVFAILAYTLRTFLDQYVHGVVWRWGRRYNENDVVIADGKHGRIVRIGFFFTEIFIYNLPEHNPPTQGWSWMIPNDKLRDVKFFKPLPKHDLNGNSNHTT